MLRDPARTRRSRGPTSTPRRRALSVSILEGLFGVQYTTLTAGTLLTAFLVALGASPFEIGLAATFPFLGGLMQPLGAELIRTRGGRRKGIALAFATADASLWVVVAGLVLVAPAHLVLPLVLGVLMLQQMALAVTGVAWTSWISDVVPPPLRGRYFGRRNFVCNGFGALTAAVSGQLIRAGGGEAPAFLAAIGVGVVMRAVSLHFMRRQPEPHRALSAEGSLLARLRQPLAHRDYRRYLVYSLAWGFSVNLAAPFFTVYMLKEAGVGVSAVLLFAGLGTASNLLGQRFWGPICDRYGDRAVLRYTGYSIALQPLWWLFTGPEGPAFYLMGALSCTGAFAWSGHALASANLMMRLAPEASKTSFFAVQGAFNGIFGAAGPLAGGALAGVLGAGGGAVLPVLGGFKALFALSSVLRLGACGLLVRVPEPIARPRLRATLLIRDAVRTFNPAQGFSPLLQPFLPTSSPLARRPRRARRRAPRR